MMQIIGVYHHFFAEISYYERRLDATSMCFIDLAMRSQKRFELMNYCSEATGITSQNFFFNEVDRL